VLPTLGRVGPVAIGTHDVFVGLGVLAALAVFLLEVRRRGMRDERLWVIVAGGLTGGAVFGRLGTWLEHLDLRANATLAEQWLYGNRSILSGLVGAYLGVLAAKKLTGYRARTGDLFAPAVALGMAIGRIGCLLTELPGTPTGGGWGITLTPQQAAAIPGGVAGVPLHPSFAYEIAFHLAAFAALVWVRPRLRAPGESLTLYLIAYAAFRFFVEFVRGNAVVFAGLSRPQLFLAACLPFGIWHVVRAARRGTYDFRKVNGGADVQFPGHEAAR
jgi:phosphatidylglycerol:prolipoprotein diacylglycerol transferase